MSSEISKPNSSKDEHNMSFVSIESDTDLQCLIEKKSISRIFSPNTLKQLIKAFFVCVQCVFQQACFLAINTPSDYWNLARNNDSTFVHSSIIKRSGNLAIVLPSPFIHI